MSDEMFGVVGKRQERDAQSIRCSRKRGNEHGVNNVPASFESMATDPS